MPQRPRSCHCTSRYCCAIVRKALLMWTLPTFIRSALALAARNGSTALLVIAMPLPAENRVRLLGFMQLISLAICLDRPITTAVVHEPVTNDDTDSSELTSLISGSPGSTPHAASDASDASDASAPSATTAATGARRCRVCNFLVAVGAAESN